jgi:hypothetical protein
VNDDGASECDEEEQQILHVGEVEIEVPNEVQNKSTSSETISNIFYVRHLNDNICTGCG